MKNINRLFYVQLMLEMAFKDCLITIDKYQEEYRIALNDNKDKIFKKIQFYRQFFDLLGNSLRDIRSGIDTPVEKIFNSWSGDIISYHDAFFDKDRNKRCYYYCNECKDISE